MPSAGCKNEANKPDRLCRQGLANHQRRPESCKTCPRSRGQVSSVWTNSHLHVAHTRRLCRCHRALHWHQRQRPRNRHIAGRGYAHSGYAGKPRVISSLARHSRGWRARTDLGILGQRASGRRSGYALFIALTPRPKPSGIISRNKRLKFACGFYAALAARSGRASSPAYPPARHLW